MLTGSSTYGINIFFFDGDTLVGSWPFELTLKRLIQNKILKREFHNCRITNIKQIVISGTDVANFISIELWISVTKRDGPKNELTLFVIKLCIH